MQRSEAFKRVAEQVVTDYVTPPKNRMLTPWFKKFAPKWRNRVGIPRLTAEAALFESLGLLRSINRGVFRGDEEMQERYDNAITALDELATEFASQNWRRFEGEIK